VYPFCKNIMYLHCTQHWCVCKFYSVGKHHTDTCMSVCKNKAQSSFFEPCYSSVMALLFFLLQNLLSFVPVKIFPFFASCYIDLIIIENCFYCSCKHVSVYMSGNCLHKQWVWCTFVCTENSSSTEVLE